MNMKKTIFNLKNKTLRQKSIQQSNILAFNEKMTSTELKALQLKKLKKLFVYVKNNVPYYQEKFKDIEIEDINTLKDWEKLPVLTKEDIRNNTEDLKASHLPNNRFSSIQTGGSTGKPLTLYHDKNFPFETVSWRVLKWWDITPYDNMAFIQRREVSGISGAINKLLWYPTQRVFLNVSTMTEENMYTFYIQLLKKKPLMLQGYVAGVFEFAKFCQKNSLNIDFLKAIWVTAAPLPESSRTFMEGVLHAPVYDQYGCAEVFWISAECKKRESMHVLADIRYLEVLDNTYTSVATEVYGDITITDLENYAFPLIRYKNGDRGRYLNQTCSCGLSFPIIDKIDGRVSDILEFKSGKVIPAHHLVSLFDSNPKAIKDFQVFQHKNHSLTLFCVLPYPDSTGTICEQKVDYLKKLTDYEVPVSLEIVDYIGHDDGKTRFIVSEVNS